MSPSPTRRILVVDDSAAVRASLESLLEPFGFEVEHAEDGSAGLRRCGASRYDLVMLDLHMPVLDGPTMLRFLRQWGNKTPVVLVTSAADTKLLASVIKLGNADYVCKPFDPRQIHAALSRALGIPPDLLVAESPRALVVDGGEGTAELVRGALPPHVAVDRAVTGEAVEALARKRAYRLVLVDGVTWGREAADALGGHLRALQPEAGLFLLDDPERTSDGRRRVASGPFDGVVPRPPPAAVVREFFYPNCLRNLALASGTSVVLAAFRGHDEDMETYFEVGGRRLLAALRTVLQDASGVRVDLSRVPTRPEQVRRLVSMVLHDSADLEADLEFVVSLAMRAALTEGGQRPPVPLLVPGEDG